MHAVELRNGPHYTDDLRRIVAEIVQIHPGQPGIVPGRSVAGIELGAAESLIEQRLDAAERVPGEDGEIGYRYPGRGLEVFAWRGTVGGFFLTGLTDDGTTVCSARTNEGLGVGSARSAVERVYGTPDLREANLGHNGFDAHVYSERGIAFCYSTFDRQDQKAPVAAIVVRPSMSIISDR